MHRSLLLFLPLVGIALAHPYHLEARQASTTPSSSSTTSTSSTTTSLVPAATTSSTTTATSATSIASAVSSVTLSNTTLTASPGTLLTTGTATATLFQVAADQFAAVPATSTPLSGCVIASQTSSSALVCQCAGSTTASVGTIYNTAGVESLYCNTGQTGFSFTADATSTLSAEPGSATNPGWADVSCTYGSLTNNLANPWLQWNDSGAEAAWNDAVADWNGQGQGTYFTDFLLNYLHAPFGEDCENLGNDLCAGAVSCGQGSSANFVMDSPAAYVIMSSIIQLRSFLNNFYQFVLPTAYGNVEGNIGNFITQFSPLNAEIAAEEAEQREEKLIFDAVQVSLTFLFAFSFGDWLKGTSWFKNNQLAVTGSLFQGEMTSTFTFIKDGLSEQSTLPVQNNVSQYVSTIESTWLDATQNISTAVFGDPATMYSFIQDGQLFTPGNPNATDTPELTLVEQVLYAHALPLVWTTGTGGSVPVLISSDWTANGSCASSAPVVDGPAESGIEAWNVNADGDVFTEALFCDGNTAYWLVTAAQSNDVITVSTPYGLSAMTGAQYSGLTSQLVFENILGTWKANNQMNSNATTFSPNITTIEDLSSTSLAQIYGAISIPVCDITALSAPVQANSTVPMDQNPFWPCPADGAPTVPGVNPAVPLKPTAPAKPVPGSSGGNRID